MDTQPLNFDENSYLKLIENSPNNTAAVQDLAVHYFLNQKYEQASQILIQAIQHNALNAQGYYTLGLVLEKLDNQPLAAQAYKDAIALDEQLIDAYNNLGNLYLSVGNINWAEEVFFTAIAQAPEQFGTYLNMGNLLILQAEFAQAIEAYQIALELNPNHQQILENLDIAQQFQTNPAQGYLYAGNYFYQRQNYHETIIKLTEFILLETGTPDIYYHLADSYAKIEQYEKAIEIYQQALELYPHDPQLYFGLIGVWGETGNPNEVIETAQKATQLFPEELLFKLQYHLTLPVIYNNYQEIEYYRTRFSQELTELIDQTPLNTPKEQQIALQGIRQHSNFFLAAQGYNNLNLQKQYGQWIYKIISANFPEYVKPKKMPVVEDKIRVGYVSGCFWGHTVGKLSLGWIDKHNPEKFALYCYYLNSKTDDYTKIFQNKSFKFSQYSNNFEQVYQDILADNLHILVFIDIGQQSEITCLAAMRLAPIQCTTWAHPETSGLPTINYFLSSELMEPANPQQHYSEQVVLLPNLGISYPQPTPPPLTKTRADFQLKNNAIVYLCSQTLHKYLPQNDSIFAAIAQRVPNAQFVFIARPNLTIAKRFLQRLKRTFANYQLNAEDYCVIVPQLDSINYWNLNRLSDIYLDSFGWSGGHTTLDAIACNLPVVTYPGEMMRSRHSTGILKMLNLISTIAKDKADYIEIAVRLGLDLHWRSQILDKIKAHQSLLWDDLKPIQALETFYQSIINYQN